MKILFFTRFFTGESFGRDPLGILYLSSALKKAGHKVDIVDAFSYKEISKVVREFRPEVVGFNIRTGHHRYYLNLNYRLKKEIKVFSIFGGPHATFFPEMIEQEEEADAVCIGEAEEAIVEFTNRLQERSDFERTGNFWVRREGEIFKNSVRPFIEDLNKIEFPDRDLLQRYKRVANFPVKSFITTRGCPYNCSYCYNYSLGEIYKGKGRRVRRRSVDNVLTEIKTEYLKRPFDIVNFEDDILILSLDWIKEFSLKYKKEVGLPFCCNIRANLVQEDIIASLKYAGCISAVMGIESGNDFIRNQILNKEITWDEIVKAAHIVKKYGIRLECENILGIPGGSLEADFETANLDIICKPDYAASYLFQPHPKTILGEIAIKEYGFSGDYDEISDFYRDTALNIKNRVEIENLQKLFPYLVEFPWLINIIRLLIKIPAGPIYRFLNKMWIGYCARFRIMPYRFKIWEFFLDLYRFMTR